MDIHAVFFMVKDLFKKLFLHSPKRTFFVVGGLIVMLALPLTLLLSQQSQDIRQRASSNGTSVGDYNTSLGGTILFAKISSTSELVFAGDVLCQNNVITKKNPSTGVREPVQNCSELGSSSVCKTADDNTDGFCVDTSASPPNAVSYSSDLVTITKLRGDSSPLSGYGCAAIGCTEHYTCAYGEYSSRYEYRRDTLSLGGGEKYSVDCPSGSTCRNVNINRRSGIQCVKTTAQPSCGDKYPGLTCNPASNCVGSYQSASGTTCSNVNSNFVCCTPRKSCYDIDCGTGTTCVQKFAGASEGYCAPVFSLRSGALCNSPLGPNTSACSTGLFCNSSGICASVSTGGGVTQPTPSPTPTPALPSVGAVKVFNCEAGLTNPGDIIFGWTRQEWGLNYEVRWGSTQSYSEKLTFGETSQTNVISGFTPGRVVYYSIRAYRGTVAGPSSIGQFTVRTSCPTSGTGGTGVGGSPTQAPAPSPIPGTATQGQTCDNNHFSAEYPGCNTSIKNAEGNSLTCGMYNGMPFGVCNFFTQTACQGGIGSLANGKPCGCPEDCQSGICEQYSGGAVSVSTFCQAPKIPTKPPAPTVAEDPCSVTSNKPANCSCSSSNQCSTNFCDTGSVGRTGTYKCTTPIAESTKPPTPTNSPTPTTRPGLTCDPNKDGKIDTLDFQWLKDEMGGTRTTKVADCFKADGVVNALDFQVWKDINFGKKPAF